jgi:O-antigen/teichoic acid export membrane protein
MAGPISWVATILLVKQANGYAEMGLFSAATQWRTAIAFLPSVLGQLALPILANLYGQDGFNRYRKALILTLAINTAGAACVALPVCVAAPYIMHIYGPAFGKGSTVLVLLALVSILTAANNVVGSAIVSSGAAWLGFLFNTLWALALLAGAWFLIPRYGSTGLALAFLMAYIAHSIWQSLYFARHLSARSKAPPQQTLCVTDPPQPGEVWGIPG